MKVLAFLLTACLLAYAAPGQAELRIRLAVPYPPDSTIGEAAATLKTEFNAHLSGSATITIVQFDGAAENQDVIAALHEGAYDMAALPSTLLIESEDSELKLFDLPFLFTTLEEVQALQSSEVGEVLLGSLERQESRRLGLLESWS